MTVDVDAAVHAWDEDGFAIVPAYVPASDLAPAVAELPLVFPTADEFHDGVDRERNRRFEDDEFAGIKDFPFVSSTLSLLAVHPLLIDLAARLLRTDDLRTYSIEAWAKYTGATNYDQHHHRDYLSQTLVVPSSDPRFAQVEMFLYLVDVPVDLGPPSFLARRHTTGCHRSRTGIRAPTERPTLTIRAGCWRPAVPSCMSSKCRVQGLRGPWRPTRTARSTAAPSSRSARYTLHVNFRPAGNEWNARHSWQKHANTEGWPAFVERASARQLALFGWPPPGHPYWTEETIIGTQLRYPGLDTSPWTPT